MEDLDCVFRISGLFLESVNGDSYGILGKIYLHLDISSMLNWTPKHTFYRKHVRNTLEVCVLAIIWDVSPFELLPMEWITLKTSIC